MRLPHRWRRIALRVTRPEVGHATWADWVLFDDLVAAGRTAAEDFLGIAH